QPGRAARRCASSSPLSSLANAGVTASSDAATANGAAARNISFPIVMICSPPWIWKYTSRNERRLYSPGTTRLGQTRVDDVTGIGKMDEPDTKQRATPSH